jgi:hypothetical protein
MSVARALTLSRSSKSSPRLLSRGPWAQLVAKLRWLRGVESLTALGIAVAIGDFSRPASAAEFMSFVGLVPAQYGRDIAERNSYGGDPVVGSVASCGRWMVAVPAAATSSLICLDSTATVSRLP